MFVSGYDATSVNPCPEVFPVSIVTETSGRGWKVEERKKEGEAEGRKPQRYTQGPHCRGT